MQDDRIFYVYVLFRPWDGSPFYVGKGKGKRWLHHERLGPKHYNPLIRRILAKADRLSLDIPKVRVRQEMTESEAFETEMAFIAAIGRNQNGGPLANSNDGGIGMTGWRHTEDGLAKMKAARVNRKLSPRHKANVSKSLLGNKRRLGQSPSDETRAKMSKSGGKTKHWLGKKRSNKYRLDRSARQKAKWADPTFRAMMTAARQRS